MSANKNTIAWVLDLLSELRNKGFYGKVTLQFEAGKVTVVRKEETIKPPPDL